MKLVTFTYKGNTHIGALVNRDGKEQVVDLNSAEPALPTDMITFLEQGESARKLAEKALSGKSVPLSDVKLHAPIPRPGKILCIGLNYKDHAIETGKPLPPYPIVFAKYANAVIASGEAIVIPRVTEEIDYEAELAFVIGKRGRYISEANAMSHVAGYMPFNDVSARAYQNRVSQWTMGKSFDTFAPMGPALTTTDEVADPHNLKIKLTIDGQTYQDSNTCNLVFNVPRLIASISEAITLEPGDVVATGTPPGVGDARNPKRWLKPGETVSIEIERLGTLTNPVKAE